MIQETQVFSNDWIRQGLQRREMIEPLEHLLSEEIERYKALKKLKDDGKLDFGPKIRAKDIEELLLQVKPDVDAFLGVNDVGVPKVNGFDIRYYLSYVIALIGAHFIASGAGIIPTSNPDGFDILIGSVILLEGTVLGLHTQSNHFSPSKKRIKINEDKRTNIILTTGHEYAHFVYYCVNHYVNKKSEIDAMIEGFAFGVERYIANLYKQSEDNLAFLYEISENLFITLNAAYKKCCKKNKQQPKQSMLNVDAPGLSIINYHHILGYVACALEEMAQGNGIYKQMLQGTFQPVLVVPN